jgi:hypothetical protein
MVNQLGQQQQQRLHHLNAGLQGRQWHAVTPRIHQLPAAAHNTQQHSTTLAVLANAGHLHLNVVSRLI